MTEDQIKQSANVDFTVSLVKDKRVKLDGSKVLIPRETILCFRRSVRKNQLVHTAQFRNLLVSVNLKDRTDIRFLETNCELN